METSDSPQCISSIDASVFENVPDVAIQEEIQKESQAASINQCSALNLGPGDGNIADELDRFKQEKEEIKRYN